MVDVKEGDTIICLAKDGIYLKMMTGECTFASQYSNLIEVVTDEGAFYSTLDKVYEINGVEVEYACR